MQKNIFNIEKLNLWYQSGENHALKDIDVEVPSKNVTALIGPSGCGKSTLLRCLNRMNNLIDGVEINGSIIFENKHQIVTTKKQWFKKPTKEMSSLELRTRIGMVFQKPNPFPMSIYDNVAYGPKAAGIKKKHELNAIVEQSLKDASLWEQVKDRLHESALGLSGGQQQRLCIARAIAMKPEVLLMDEPTSALDPNSTLKIEKLINKLKKTYTIIIVTHSMQQAFRIADYTAFMYMGELLEFNTTKKIFTDPTNKKTKEYISGKIG